MRRALKWTAVGLAVLAVLLVAAWLSVNLLGRREWQKTRAELEARGETFDYAKLLPPPVPDEQNFAMTPLLRPLLDYDFDWKTKETTWRDPAGKERAEAVKLPEDWHLLKPDWQKGERLDAVAWQASDLTPADFLARLRSLDEPLSEIARAALRPAAHFPVHYQDGSYASLPHGNVIIEIAKILAWKASAHLALENHAAAADEVLLSLRLVWLLRDQPSLIDHLIWITQIDFALGTIWNGLAAQQWTDTELESFQATLSQLDPLASFRLALRGEAAFSAIAYKQMRSDPELLNMLSEFTSTRLNFLQWVPRGILDLNEAAQQQIIFQDLIPALTLPDPLFPEKWARVDHLADGSDDRSFYPGRILSAISLPVYRTVMRKAVENAATVNLAVTALALERYRLEHQVYPPSLAELAPAYLSRIPPDITTGQTPHYEADGATFDLYTDGWNQTDDGGEIALKSNGKSLDRTAGDWVWPRYDRASTAPAR